MISFSFYFNFFILPFMYLSCFLTCLLGNLNDHHVCSLLPRYLLASCSCSYRFALGLGGPFSTFSDVFLHIWKFIFPSMTSHAISLGHASARIQPSHFRNWSWQSASYKLHPDSTHSQELTWASCCLFHFLTYPLNGHRHTGYVSIWITVPRPKHMGL